MDFAFPSFRWYYERKSFGIDADCHNKFITASIVQQDDQSLQRRILVHCPSQQPNAASSDRLLNGKPNCFQWGRIYTRINVLYVFIIIYKGGVVSSCVHDVRRPFILGSTLILQPPPPSAPLYSLLLGK